MKRGEGGYGGGKGGGRRVGYFLSSVVRIATLLGWYWLRVLALSLSYISVSLFLTILMFPMLTAVWYLPQQ